MTLERLLEKDRQIGIASSEDSVGRATKSLQDLSLMFSHDEANIVKQHCRGESSGTSTPARGQRMYRPLRRVLGDEGLNEGTHQWMSSSTSSGRLPGVYQNVSPSFIPCLGGGQIQHRISIIYSHNCPHLLLLRLFPYLNHLSRSPHHLSPPPSTPTSLPKD